MIAFGSEARVFAATTTQAGLKVRCEIDANTYPKGVKVEDDEMDALKIVPTTSTANGTIRSRHAP